MSEGVEKPVIGITVDASPDPGDCRTRGKLSLNWNYAQAVAEAGGVPVLIPPQADPEAVATIVDGWLIPGGDDIDPRHWGDERHPQAKLVAQERFDCERRFFGLVPKELPLLGICYGCQFLNVANGGSLHQHLPDVVGHESDAGGKLQEYVLDETSLVARALGADRVEGESWHHQAVDRLGQTIRVVGHNEDGTVEAIESVDRPWMIGVQWHPERTLEDESSRRLFRAFVEAAAAYRRRRL